MGVCTQWQELICHKCGGKFVCEQMYRRRHLTRCPMCGSSNTRWGRTFNEAEVMELFLSNYPGRQPSNN